VAGPDFSETLNDLDKALTSIEAVVDPDRTQAEIAELQQQVAVPNLWDDPENAQRVTSRLSTLQAEIDRVANLRSRLDDLAVMVELGQEEGDAASLIESEAELASLRKAIDALEVRTLLSGEYDAREALVTIRSEAGGIDAADFAAMLLRMYLRWAERHHYTAEVYDTSYAEEAGIKSATFQVKAPFAYGTLSVEQGTHRLVRISPFDNQGRRQTSFAGVEVLPVVDRPPVRGRGFGLASLPAEQIFTNSEWAQGVGQGLGLGQLHEVCRLTTAAKINACTLWRLPVSGSSSRPSVLALEQ